ncbi:substrate-binding periplasmic protein [Pseudodesulfovibrio piezophilus]|uniref:Extracellular solute-binding protein family 3 n=1 Tax=Pseudodesulfovibrio piezophilus (strain DSM 21447 / JCM 15486 / C1TLV30) TaxID=1322246 RepID=M1WRH3_PSEP2|nr:transporter substrate-binding domain-containing protein [Pseudodesulfovibrio piezophilus]CCH49549.1 Extracellular solute-binding protein family 3 [Pseudodesulfovibrio piezophilus C1TLV30]
MRSYLFAFALVLTIFASTAMAQHPVFVTNIDFAPYSMEKDGQPAGIDVDVITEAAKRAGLDIQIDMAPLDTLLLRLKTGECVGAFALFPTPDRDKVASFMRDAPIHFSEYVLFTKVGDTFSFDSYTDLKRKIIGRIAGTDLGKEFHDALDAGIMQAKDYPDLTAALRGLLSGEIDAYAGNIDVTYYRLKDMGLTSSIVYLPKKLLTKKPSYLALSRTSTYPHKEEILQALGIAISKMRQDGTYNKIARRYLIRF